MALGISLVRASFSLHADQRVRVAIVFIFLLGFMTIVGACIRLGLAVHSFKQFGSNLLHRSHQGAWLSTIVAIITLGEMSIALVTISLPSLRVLLRSQRRSDDLGEHYRTRRGPGTSRGTDYDYLESCSGSGISASVRTEETSPSHELADVQAL